MLPLLFLIFIVLNLIDWGLTSKLLSLGGIEQNPLMLMLFSFGPWAALAFKIIGIVIILKLCQWVVSKNYVAGLFTLVLIDLLYILIVLNNLYWYVILR